MSRVHRGIFRALCPLLLLTAGVRGQSPAGSPIHVARPHQPEEWVGGWRDTPASVAEQDDTASPSVRAARDKFWDSCFPPEPDGVKFGYTKGGVIASSTPWADAKEVSKEATRFPWVIGEFESFHVFQTSRGGGVYTEMNIRIQHVFKTHGAGDLRSGQLVDVALRGGSIMTRSGRRVNFLVHDDDPGMQPGHLYLLELVPCMTFDSLCGNSGFYYTGRKWDLTYGRVRAIDTFDLRMGNEGRSVISDSDASTIVERFQQILSTVDGHSSLSPGQPPGGRSQ